MRPELDYFVHEKFYKLGAQQRRALGLESEEAFVSQYDSKGKLIERDDPGRGDARRGRQADGAESARREQKRGGVVSSRKPDRPRLIT